MSDKTTITLPAQLDLAHVESLNERLDQALVKEVSIFELNANKIERVDSAGIQLLLSFIVVVKESGKEFMLVKQSDEFIRSVELLGATELLELLEL